MTPLSWINNKYQELDDCILRDRNDTLLDTVVSPARVVVGGKHVFLQCCVTVVDQTDK
jgi:hypothetical protein